MPPRLWRWRIIAGWRWKHGREHINAEMRAIEAAIRWRIEHQEQLSCQILHLTDSLVCLHTVSRGRSSSKKLRRCVCRLNALLLASGVAPVWDFAHTDQNPADKLSRWAAGTKFRNAKGRAWEQGPPYTGAATTRAYDNSQYNQPLGNVMKELCQVFLAFSRITILPYLVKVTRSTICLRNIWSIYGLQEPAEG